MMTESFDPNGVGVNNGCYFGLPFGPQEAALVLLSAPWDVTVSYGAGTADAPAAMIEASTQIDLYDAAAPDEWRRGIATLPVDEWLRAASRELRAAAGGVIAFLEAGGDPNEVAVAERLAQVNAGCREMNGRIRAEAARRLAEGKLVGLVGGDHSTPYGLIRAVAERHAAFGILHVDAHCDLRDAYEGFQYSHASIMHNVLADVPQVTRLVQVGVRDYCDAEAERIATEGRIAAFTDAALAAARFEGETWGAQCRRIVAELPAEVYVSFDIDGLSIEHCPHTGTPVPGGLTYAQACYLLEQLVASGRRIIGFDLVETVPHAGDCIDLAVAVRVLYKLCGLTLKSNK